VLDGGAEFTCGSGSAGTAVLDGGAEFTCGSGSAGTA
jgi:hypothetical protein